MAISLFALTACAQVAGLKDIAYDPDATSDTTSPGGGPTLAGCPMFPADNEWNRDISSDPVDPASATYIASMSPDKSLHPDWGSVSDNYGIPYAVVPKQQTPVDINFLNSAESDPGPYPIPADVPVEGGDAHVLVLQQDTCVLFEMYKAVKDPASSGWHATSGARFVLSKNTLRSDGFTSADSAGLPILPGLARVDEVLDRREIKHALRFTASMTQAAFVHPATHFTGASPNPALPPMGLRVRLKASFDTSSFSPDTRVVLVALKRYGMFLADNGTDWYVTGTRDERWAADIMDAMVTEMRKVHGSDFEVVKVGTIQTR